MESEKEKQTYYNFKNCVSAHCNNASAPPVGGRGPRSPLPARPTSHREACVVVTEASAGILEIILIRQMQSAGCRSVHSIIMGTTFRAFVAQREDWQWGCMRSGAGSLAGRAEDVVGWPVAWMAMAAPATPPSRPSQLRCCCSNGHGLLRKVTTLSLQLF